MTELFFIYGTLKKGFKNHHILENCGASFVTDAVTNDKFPMFDLGHGFPYLQLTWGVGEIVHGEIWEIPSDKIPYLDNFEGVPHLYKRIMNDCYCPEGRLYPRVHTYFKAEPLDKGELEQQQFLSQWLKESHE